MRVKWIFAVIKNIAKARDPGNEVVLFNMVFPKEFMNLCRQPVAWGAKFSYNSFAILMKLLPSGQNLVTFQSKMIPSHVTSKHAQMVRISGRLQFTDHNLWVKETILYLGIEFKSCCNFEKILTFSLARGFDLFLSLGVTTPLTTPVMGIS